MTCLVLKEPSICSKLNYHRLRLLTREFLQVGMVPRPRSIYICLVCVRVYLLSLSSQHCRQLGTLSISNKMMQTQYPNNIPTQTRRGRPCKPSIPTSADTVSRLCAPNVPSNQIHINPYDSRPKIDGSKSARHRGPIDIASNHMLSR